MGIKGYTWVYMGAQGYKGLHMGIKTKWYAWVYTGIKGVYRGIGTSVYTLYLNTL